MLFDRTPLLIPAKRLAPIAPARRLGAALGLALLASLTLGRADVASAANVYPTQTPPVVTPWSWQQFKQSMGLIGTANPAYIAANPSSSTVAAGTALSDGYLATAGLTAITGLNFNPDGTELRGFVLGDYGTLEPNSVDAAGDQNSNYNFFETANTSNITQSNITGWVSPLYAISNARDLVIQTVDDGGGFTTGDPGSFAAGGFTPGASATVQGEAGTGYHSALVGADVTCTWTLTAPAPGTYTIYANIPFGTEASLTAVPYTITGGTISPVTGTVDQALHGYQLVGGVTTTTTKGPRLNAVSVTGYDYSDTVVALAAAGKALGVGVQKHPALQRSLLHAERQRRDGRPRASPPTRSAPPSSSPTTIRVGDEANKLDYDNMTKVVRLAGLGILTIADAPADAALEQGPPAHRAVPEGAWRGVSRRWSHSSFRDLRTSVRPVLGDVGQRALIAGKITAVLLVAAPRSSSRSFSSMLLLPVAIHELGHLWAGQRVGYRLRIDPHRPLSLGLRADDTPTGTSAYRWASAKCVRRSVWPRGARRFSLCRAVRSRISLPTVAALLVFFHKRWTAWSAPCSPGGVAGWVQFADCAITIYSERWHLHRQSRASSPRLRSRATVSNFSIFGATAPVRSTRVRLTTRITVLIDACPEEVQERESASCRHGSRPVSSIARRLGGRATPRPRRPRPPSRLRRPRSVPFRKVDGDHLAQPAGRASTSGRPAGRSRTFDPRPPPSISRTTAASGVSPSSTLPATISKRNGSPCRAVG